MWILLHQHNIYGFPLIFYLPFTVSSFPSSTLSKIAKNIFSCCVSNYVLLIWDLSVYITEIFSCITDSSIQLLLLYRSWWFFRCCEASCCLDIDEVNWWHQGAQCTQTHWILTLLFVQALYKLCCYQLWHCPE